VNKLSLVVIIALALFVTPAAFAWPACSGNWIQVPAGTNSANGAVVTENGQTFQCQKPAPTPTPSSNTNTNNNQNSNINNNSSSSKSNSNSHSNSTAVGTGGDATAIGKGGTGGNANVGPISVTQGPVTATTGPSTSSSDSTSAATNNGNGSNNASYSSTENVAASKIPVATAYAGAPAPTATCALGYGGGVQTMTFGFSGGGSRVDKNCAILEAARAGASYGGRLAFCKLYVSNKLVQKAGYTLADCLGDTLNVPAPEPKVTEVPVVPQVPILVAIDPNPAPKMTPPLVTPSPIAPVVPAQNNEISIQDVGACQLSPTGKLTNVCLRILDDVIIRMRTDPESILRVNGPEPAVKVAPYLRARGISASRITLNVKDEGSWALTFDLIKMQ
jgi:hypothetical protein